MSSSLSPQLEEAGVVPGELTELGTVPLSQTRIAWRRFRAHKLGLAGLIILVLLYLAVIFAPVIAPYSPTAIDLDHVREPPSSRHLMGTDELGRDELSRVIYGGRVSLAVGLGAALSAGVVGTLLGAFAGFRGGWADNIVMRVTDLFLALPFLAVAMIGATALPGRIIDIVILLAAIFWMPVARIVRGMTLSLKEKEYVEAARASGAGGFRIISRHILPNTLGPVVVNITLGIALAILAESTLSFLSLGIQPPTATWGNMLAGSRESMFTQPWLIWFPGLMILITVLSVNFMGDALRDAIDPTAQRMQA